jgi:hypothetical protein
MASSFTTNKNIEKPGYNDYAANPTGWSGPINADWDIIDRGFGGVLGKSTTGGTTNLTITETQNLVLIISGTLVSNATFTLPLNTALTGIVAGQWIVKNATSGSFTVTFAPTSGGGTSIAIPQGQIRVIFSDGTNVAETVSIPTQIPSGTAMLFAQTNAPTGWTKSTTHNNKALRVVSGAASSGGSVDFTTAFSSQSVTGTVGGTSLSISQIPAHRHYAFLNAQGSNDIISGEIRSQVAYTAGNPASGYYIRGNDAVSEPTLGPSSATGSGSSHDHTFTGTAINLSVAYVDVIIATKD